ncbi:MAG: ribbon-helix-helix protein, CopG family [Proteobacteria bacterium]|nr:ribbon-helix-helix protein, CopG family [Pseudomonadota bacterium]
MTLTVRLKADLEKRLNKLSKKTHRSKSSFMVQALEEYLADQEDYYDALDRKMRLDKEIDKPISWDDLKAASGLR